MSAPFPAGDLANFERNGFAILRKAASEDTITRMRAVVRDHLDRAIEPIEFEADVAYPGAPASRVAPGGRTVRRLKQAHARDVVFTEWMTTRAILAPLQRLLGPRLVAPLAHHNCVMTKQPSFSSETGWHQDIRYWSFQRPELVNVWLALGAEHRGNGCLQVIPGSHVEKFDREQFDDALFFRKDLDRNQPLLNQRRFVELEPGDVLFFHCLTLHAATENRSTEPKWSVVFTVRGADNLPIPGTRSTASPELILTPEG